MTDSEIRLIAKYTKVPPEKQNAWRKIRKKFQAFVDITDQALILMDEDLKQSLHPRASTEEEEHENHQQHPHTNEI